MDIETGRALVRVMGLNSLRDQRFSSRLDFSLNHRKQNRFTNEDAQLIFHFDNGQKNIWQRESPVQPASHQSHWLLAYLAPLIQIVLMRFLGIFRLIE